MSQRKGSSPKFIGPGAVQRLAKQTQREFKLTYAAAVAKAKQQLGISPMIVTIGSTIVDRVVQFTSEVTLNGATAASYAWNFGDAQTATTEDVADQTYATSGTYLVTLVVTDTDGKTVTATKWITVGSAMEATIEHTAALLVVQFTSEVVLNGATADTYAWDLDDGQTATTEDVADVTYSGAGTYDVSLTVTDTEGLTTVATTQVTVAAT